MAFLKTMWKNNSKHKKLSEEMALQKSKVIDTEAVEAVEVENDDIVTFKLKYLGSTVVEKISGENISTEAVKNIIKTTKASKGRKKVQRVDISISLKGIVVTDLQGNDILKISIYRISNCSTDPTQRQIFSFISTDAVDETMECHAFLCAKRKIAETVTLAVAHAFSTAYEEWKNHPQSPVTQTKSTSTLNNTVSITSIHGGKLADDLADINNELNQKHESKNVSNNVVDNIIKVDDEEKLIDFDNELECFEDVDDIFKLDTTLENNVNKHWVCFDDDFGNEIPSKTTSTYHQVDLILV